MRIRCRFSSHTPLLHWLGAGALLAGGVSACADGSAPRAVPAVLPVAQPAMLPVAAPAAGHCGLARFEPELLRQVNAFRAAPRSCGAHGRFAAAPPLRWSGALAQLASAHAHDMAARNTITHDDAQGRGPAQRATVAGYEWRVFAENVAGHYAGVAEVQRGWENSAGHCANLMQPAVTELGAACAAGAPAAQYKAYWAMELAQPR